MAQEVDADRRRCLPSPECCVADRATVVHSLLRNPSYGMEVGSVRGWELPISLEGGAAEAWYSSPETFDLCLPLVFTRPLQNRFQHSVG